MEVERTRFPVVGSSVVWLMCEKWAGFGGGGELIEKVRRGENWVGEVWELEESSLERLSGSGLRRERSEVAVRCVCGGGGEWR